MGAARPDYHGARGFTHVMEVETLVHGFRIFLDELGTQQRASDVLELAKNNESLRVDWRSFCDDELAVLVADHYAVDFATFGYDRASWRSPAVAGDATDDLQSRHATFEQKAITGNRERNEMIAAQPTASAPSRDPLRELLLWSAACGS